MQEIGEERRKVLQEQFCQRYDYRKQETSDIEEMKGGDEIKSSMNG